MGINSPTEPKAEYVRLMRAGCLFAVVLFIACIARDLDWVVLLAPCAIPFVILAFRRPDGNLLRTGRSVSILGFVCASAWSVSVFGSGFVNLALPLGLAIAFVIAYTGAFLAYRSLPKEARHPAPQPVQPLDPSLFRLRYAVLARISAALAIVIGFIGASRSQEGFVVFAGLFSLPYAVFVVTPHSQKWISSGRTLAWMTSVPALLFAIPVWFPGDHVTRGERHWMFFMSAVLLTQVAQLVFMLRAYTGPVPDRTVAPCFTYYVFVWILLAATLPSWYRDRIRANESYAVGAIRTLNTAAATYSSTYGAGFPPNLHVLGPPASPGEENKDAAGLAEEKLACGQPACVRSGYRFEYRVSAKDGAGVSYSISARPVEYEETGGRSFFATGDGVIHFTREDRAATANDARLD